MWCCIQQISIYSIYPINGFGYWEASVGIWGAVILFLTAGLALKKRWWWFLFILLYIKLNLQWIYYLFSPKKQVQVMAGLSAATGVVMIGLFSWSMNDAITFINAFGFGCKDVSVCKHSIIIIVMMII